MAYDMTNYLNKKRTMFDSYSVSKAMNVFDKFLNRQKADNARQDLTQQYSKNLPALLSAYGQRGLNSANVKSGAQRSGLQEFANQRIQDFSRLESGYSGDLDRLNLGDTMLDTQYASQNADLEMDKAAQQAEDARAILRARSGSY